MFSFFKTRKPTPSHRIEISLERIDQLGLGLAALEGVIAQLSAGTVTYGS